MNVDIKTWFNREPVSKRLWGIFAIRWVLPVGLLMFNFIGPGRLDDNAVVPIVIVGMVAVLTNLIVALLLVTEVWLPSITLGLAVVDLILAAVSILYTDVRFAWIGLLPLGMLGMIFSNWLHSLSVGVALSAVLILAELLFSPENSLTVALLVFILLAYPATGPITGLFFHEQQQALPRIPPIRRTRDESKRSPVSESNDSTLMQIFHEVAEVLSLSRLDPIRVMDAAIDVGMEGLKKLGARPILFAAVLLYDQNPETLEPVLRITRASSTVKSTDWQVMIPGKNGAVGDALNQGTAVNVGAPTDDPELSHLETFSRAGSVVCLPLMLGTDAYGVMLVGSEHSNAFDAQHIELLKVITNQAAAAINNAQMYVSLLEQKDRVVSVEKTARAQLAADLHDGPTQGMSAITMRLNYARRLLDKDPTQVPDELYQLEELARNTTKEIRAMLFTLRPKAMEQGLSAGLDQLAKQVAETYDQTVEVQVAPHIDQLLDEQTGLTLFSIVTETLNNVRKHAEATLVKVSADSDTQQFVLTVEDDGKGFDVQKALAEARQREGHLGLINLYERAALVDGQLTIESEPGQGTQMTVVIPLATLKQRQAEESQQAEEAG